MDLKKLSKPFNQDEITWRLDQQGIDKNGKPWARIVPYIDARDVQARLDQIVGPENWQVSYEEMKKGIMCGIGIRVAEHAWIWKYDGAQETDIESFKGGISRAFVRAGSAWGIGRELYSYSTEFAETTVAKDPSFPNYAVFKNKDTKFPIKYWWRRRKPNKPASGALKTHVRGNSTSQERFTQ